MGCDIHVYIERKIEDQDKWENVSLYRVRDNNIEVVDPYDGRNYELFSILAGVRGWQEPLIDPRGFPGGMNTKTVREVERWDGDYHTPTWYDLFELNMFAEKYKDNEDYQSFIFFVDCINTYVEYAMFFYWRDLVKPNQYRVIMFFDN